jgi:hypothetical protein
MGTGMRNAHALLRVEPAVRREADELIAILVASARTARAR